MILAFIHGFILAIGLILPLGAQNLFIFSQGTIHKRWMTMIPIIVTAGISDTLLITAAVFGVSVVVMNLIWMKLALVAGGVLFLTYMGIITWRTKPKLIGKDAGTVQSISFMRTVSFTLMVSLLNPHAILDTIGVIGTSSLPYHGLEKIAFTAACIIVSWMWFLTLAVLGRFVGMRDQTGRFLFYLNKISALIMWAAALYLIVTF